MTPAHMRVALKLAGLSVGDREWLLERFDDNTRETVLTILERLAQAGLPTLPGAENSGQAQAVVREQNANNKTLRKAKPEIVAEVLMREPEWVCALILGSENWPWFDAVIALFPEERRKQVADNLRKGRAPIKQGVTETLIELFSETINAELERRASSSRFEKILTRIESVADL